MPDEEITQIIEKSLSLYYSGSFQQAVLLIDQSMDLIQSNEDKVESTSISNQFLQLELTSLNFAVQSIFLHQLDSESTINLLQNKLANIEEDEITEYHATLQDLLGLALYFKESKKSVMDLSNATNYIRKALLLRERLQSHNLAQSYFHLGIISQFSNQIDKAFNHYLQAMETVNKKGYKLLLSLITRHLGALYLQVNELEKARTLLEQSLQISLNNEYNVFVPFCCINLGDLYLKIKIIDQAHQLYQQSIEIAQKLRLDRPQALAYLSLGKYYAKKQPDKAVGAYLDSYYYARKINHEGIIQHIPSLFTSAE